MRRFLGHEGAIRLEEDDEVVVSKPSFRGDSCAGAKDTRPTPADNIDEKTRS